METRSEKDVRQSREGVRSRRMVQIGVRVPNVWQWLLEGQSSLLGLLVGTLVWPSPQ